MKKGEDALVCGWCLTDTLTTSFPSFRHIPCLFCPHRAIYEYVASGSEDEQTLWENRQGFKRVLLCPRVGRDVSKIDMR